MRQCVPYFSYRRHSITVQDSSISYWDEGSGQPLVLVHGLGGCVEYWAWVFPQLIGRFRVIALDLPGFGHSTLPDVPISYEAAADALHAFVAALHLDQPILIGHSMGGALVLRCAAKYPDAFSGVMALCPPGFGREIDLVSRVLSVPVIGETLFQPTHATIFSMLQCPDSLAGMEHLVNLTCERLRGQDAKLRHLTILRQGVSCFGQTLRFRRGDFEAFRGRVKIVWGERDPVFPVKQAARAIELIPHAELSILPAGHMLQLEQPDKIGRLIAEFAARESLGEAA